MCVYGNPCMIIALNTAPLDRCLVDLQQKVREINKSISHIPSVLLNKPAMF